MATARGFSARQGEFDGLCGLYSIVNSISTMSEGKIAPEGLMAAMIKHLNERRELASTFTIGATSARMVRLFKVARTYCQKLGFELSWKPRVAHRTATQTNRVADFWETISEHQRKAGDGSVILGLAGRHVHWSCVRRATARSFSMADSGNRGHAPLARIDRRFCTTGKATTDRPHILEEAFLLRLD